MSEEVLEEDTIYNGQKFNVVVHYEEQELISLGNAKKNLIKQGNWICLYKGEMQSYGKYKNGLPNGKWHMPFGNLIVYKNGRVVKNVHVF